MHGRTIAFLFLHDQQFEFVLLFKTFQHTPKMTKVGDAAAVSVCSELDAKLVEIVSEFENYQDIMNGLGDCLRQVSEAEIIETL